MRFILPNIKNENNLISIEEYPRRTELITRMMIEGWLTEKEVKEYLEGIISEARTPREDGAIFWTVGDVSHMPRDTMIALACEPTYNIIAFIISTYWNNKDIAESIPDFFKVLKGGMQAATFCNFRGADASDKGYTRKLIRFFERVGVGQFISDGFFADLCPEFTKMYFEYRQFFEELDCSEENGK